MLENHLDTIEKELSAMEPDKVRAFGLRCILRQAKALETAFPDQKDKKISELLLKLETTKQDFGKDSQVLKFDRTPYDDHILNNNDPENMLLYEISGNIVDFLDALYSNDIPYLVDYPAYRNLDIFESVEETIFDDFEFDDIEEDLNKKSPEIQQLMNKEMEMQLADIESLKQTSGTDSIRSLVQKEAEPIFTNPEL